MAVSFVAAAGAAAASHTIPAHLPGDLIMITAYSTNGIIPTLGSGFTNLATCSQGAQARSRVGYRFAVGVDNTSDPSGTWSNSVSTWSMIYRGASIPVNYAVNQGNSNHIDYPALTLNWAANSWVYRPGAHISCSDADATNTLAGYTQRLTLNQYIANWDSNGALTGTIAAASQNVNATGDWLSHTVEIPPGAAYDAVSTGNVTASGANTITTTDSITVVAGANIYLAFAVTQSGAGAGVYSGHTRTVTCDGVAMTPLTVYHENNSSSLGWVELWEARNLSAGARSLSVTVAKTNVNYANLKVAAVSYCCVINSVVISPAGGTTNATTMPHTLTGLVSSYLLRVASTQLTGLATLSNSSRYLSGGSGPGLGLHDIRGSASTGFTSVRATGDDWASLGLEIKWGTAVSNTVTGIGTLTATTLPKIALTKGFTGSGTLTATAVPSSVSASAPLTGHGALTVTAVATQFSLTWAKTGSGALTATRYQKFSVIRSISGPGVLTATAVATKFTLTTPLTGHGTLTATASQKSTVARVLTGLGSLTATAVATKFTLSRTLTGLGVLTVTRYQKFSCSCNITGAGTLSATATIYRIACSAALSGPGALTATARAKFASSVAPSGHGVLGATASMYRIAASFASSGAGALTATSLSKFSRLVAVVGSGALSATATMYRIASAAAIGGHGGLTALASAKCSVTAGLSGSGSLATTAVATKFTLPCAFAGIGSLSSSAYPGFTRGAPLTGSGILSVSARMYSIQVNTALTGVGTLTATMAAEFFRVVPFVGQGVLSAEARMYRTAVSAELSGVGAHTTVGFARYPSSASLSGSGALTATARLYGIHTTATHTGNGDLTSVVFSKLPSDLIAVGSGALTAILLAKVGLSAPLTGQGELTALIGSGVSSTASFTGSATLSAAVRMYQITGQADTLGAGVLSATAISVEFCAASFTGTGSISVQTFSSLVVEYTGTGILSADALATGFIFDAPLVGVGAMFSTTQTIAPELSGQGLLEATGQLVFDVAPTTFGAGALDAQTIVVRPGVPIMVLFDSFSYRDDVKWNYQGSAQILDDQLQLGGVG